MMHDARCVQHSNSIQRQEHFRLILDYYGQIFWWAILDFIFEIVPALLIMFLSVASFLIIQNRAYLLARCHGLQMPVVTDPNAPR
jgi:hypothetical protein